MAYYEVIVSRVGRIHAGAIAVKARKVFARAKRLAQGTQGQYSGETVELWKDGNVVNSFTPKRYNPSLPANKWVGAHAVKILKKGGKVVGVQVMKEGGVKRANPKRKRYRKPVHPKIMNPPKYTFRHLKKGWMVTGPRGGRYGPFRTRAVAERAVRGK